MRKKNEQGKSAKLVWASQTGTGSITETNLCSIFVISPCYCAPQLHVMEPGAGPAHGTRLLILYCGAALSTAESEVRILRLALFPADVPSNIPLTVDSCCHHFLPFCCVILAVLQIAAAPSSGAKVHLPPNVTVAFLSGVALAPPYLLPELLLRSGSLWQLPGRTVPVSAIRKRLAASHREQLCQSIVHLPTHCHLPCFWPLAATPTKGAMTCKRPGRAPPH